LSIRIKQSELVRISAITGLRERTKEIGYKERLFTNTNCNKGAVRNMESSDRSPQSKRHSYPVILTYTETLSVLSENQREYNRKESIKRSKTPVLNQSGSDEERRQKLQQALDWLSQELVSIARPSSLILEIYRTACIYIYIN
jgi:hypothetical protein